MKIWERYFFRQFFSLFALFLFSFYALYVLIDYSTHAGSFLSYLSWPQLFLYYLWEFSLRLEVLLPFAILVAVIRTLTSLNQHNELIALLAGGVKMQRLLRPFLLLGLFFTLCLYANSQFILPRSVAVLRSYKELGRNGLEETAVKHLVLEDESKILYQSFNSLDRRFFDAYWIRSKDDLYRIKFLSPTEPPEGRFVDHITRNEEGELVLESSSRDQIFPEMRFRRERLMETLADPRELSLAALINKRPKKESAACNERECQINTLFYYKLIMPWLSLIAVIGPAPLCILYSRTLPQFAIYAGCTFALVVLYLLFKSGVILGERGIASPLYSIALPFAAAFGILLFRYFRLR